MEYMPLLLRQFLGGTAPDLPPNEFKAYLLALAHIYENEAPVTDATMARHLTGKGWKAARDRLIDRGRLVEVRGGYMDRTAHAVITDFHAEQKRAAETGRKGGLVAQHKRREAERRRAGMDDLFANGSQPASDAEKDNDFNGSDQGPLDHRAPARTRGKRDASPMHPGCIRDANDSQLGSGAKNPTKSMGAVEGASSNKEVEIEEEERLLSRSPTTSRAHTREGYAAAWNAKAEACGWPSIRKIDDKRWKALKARLADYGDEGFDEALRRASRSSLLNPAAGEPPHWFDFDFLISPSGFPKTLEGKYDELRASRDRDPTLAALEHLANRP